MNFKKNKGIIAGGIVLLLVFGAVLYFNNPFEKKSGVQAECYDQNFNQVACGSSTNLKSIVGGTEGIYYITFDVTLTAVNKDFNYLQVLSPSAASSTTNGVLWMALSDRSTDPNVLKSGSIVKGGSTTFSTKNSCTVSAANCGYNETCGQVGAQKWCFIPTALVEQYPQPFNWGVTAFGSWAGGYGQTLNITSNAGLITSILPDQVGNITVTIVGTTGGLPS